MIKILFTVFGEDSSPVELEGDSWGIYGYWDRIEIAGCFKLGCGVGLDIEIGWDLEECSFWVIIAFAILFSLIGVGFFIGDSVVLNIIEGGRHGASWTSLVSTCSGTVDELLFGEID